ncbi:MULTISPECIES: energy transducer TonB [unclassified Lentimonas]|uniref:energy transducer TonB n=1 Tax=unclassified Lentimonas TaxID=2630993 RepID=UPI00132427DD|nr:MULTISPECIES: energy transducer TonB [unclassified Lentimonas]CAA6678479.1 Unannotated [Lentimonas sp. CC4]CAA7183523.1 Unannotated [Lentimonas sp. CC8]CAA6687474.1 Unannotated [Lentimonas sp. CC6]CAA7078210.1 Unannotated [Lentimonas sp. CC4]CAA7171191.1 Unannotated [Lentimonas sp. CC21]
MRKLITFLLLLSLTCSLSASDTSKSTKAAIKDAFSLQQVDEMPIQTYQSKLAYPKKLLEKGIEGEASIELIISKNGDVIATTVIKTTHPEFGKAAQDAIKKWKFKPGTKNGKAVQVRTQIRIPFSIAPKI